MTRNAAPSGESAIARRRSARATGTPPFHASRSSAASISMPPPRGHPRSGTLPLQHHRLALAVAANRVEGVRLPRRAAGQANEPVDVASQHLGETVGHRGSGVSVRVIRHRGSSRCLVPGGDRSRPGCRRRGLPARPRASPARPPCAIRRPRRRGGCAIARMATSTSSSGPVLREDEDAHGSAPEGNGRLRASDGTVSRSFACTKPTMSSRSRPATSSREWPLATMRSSASATEIPPRHPRDVVTRHHHVAHRALTEVERAGQQIVRGLFDQSFLVRLGEHAADLVDGVRAHQLGARLDAERHVCPRCRVPAPPG